MNAGFTLKPSLNPARRILFGVITAFFAVNLLCLAAEPMRLPLQKPTVRRWVKEDGLPPGPVSAILQTSDGYLWIGTSSGLVRFDCVRFQPMPLAAEKAATIGVNALCEDSQGRLWVGTQEQGVFCFANGVMKKWNADAALTNLSITSIAEDKDGNLWVGAAAGLFCIGKDKVTHFAKTNGLSGDFVLSVHAARSGSVWVTTPEGMCQFKSGTFQPLEFQSESLGRSPEPIGVYEDSKGNIWAFGDTYLVNLRDGNRFNYFRGGDTSLLRIWSLSEGRDGQLWIGTSGQGLYAFSGGRFFPFSLRSSGLSSDVRAVYEDRAGNLWLGTHSGELLRLHLDNKRLLDQENGLPPRLASAVAIAADGVVWAGYEQGGIFSGSRDRFEPVPNRNGLDAQNLVASLCVAPDGAVWVGTLGMGLYRLKDRVATRYTTATGLSDDAVTALAVDAEGAIWAATRAGSLHRFSTNALESFGTAEGLKRGAITALLSGRTNRLWVGTEQGAVLRQDTNGFYDALAGGRALAGPITALCEDFKQRLWIGTANGGLHCLDGSGLNSWDVQSGLPDNHVLALTTDDGGNVWLETSRGIYRITRISIEQLNRTAPAPQLVLEHDASMFSTPTLGWPRVAKAANGHLWFATPRGLAAVDPHIVDNKVQNLRVLIESVIVNGAALPATLLASAAGVVGSMSNAIPPKSLRLPSNLQSLEFQFTVLELKSPEAASFQHRLVGYEADWVDNGRERAVHYAQLPYGRYEFQVRATNPDGTWNPAFARLVFDFPAPFWKTKTALVLFSVAVVGLLVGIVRLVSHRRLRRRLAVLQQQQAMEKERMRIAQDLHDDLGSKLARMSFLSELALRKDPAEPNLVSISENSRNLLQTMDEIVWAVNPHNDALENLVAYLSQYAEEYLRKTTVDLELVLTGEISELPISAEVRHNVFLAFEEALANALKHSGATKVRVEIGFHNAILKILVHDNGRGFQSTSSGERQNDAGKSGGKDGLVNMRKRLASIGGECEISSSSDEGTRVGFTLPIHSQIPKHS
ncbi:MAG: two-component regulator propeller domain-containing protein [Verrucomicrobiota bacterium]